MTETVRSFCTEFWTETVGFALRKLRLRRGRFDRKRTISTEKIHFAMKK